MKKTKHCTRGILAGILTAALAACTLAVPASAETPATPGWGGIDDVKIEQVQPGILGGTGEKTLGKDEYYEKTLAGLLGQIGGVASGYEFIKTASPAYNRIGAPVSILEDLTYGPYGGGPHYNPYDDELAGSVGQNRMWRDGMFASDDDVHIDIFNQRIIAENIDVFAAAVADGFTGDLLPVKKAIKQAWLDYQVSDWGGGYQAMRLMGEHPDDDTYLAPYTGTWEAGNVWHWCTEPYIESETLGMVFPGMPQSAYKMTTEFASLTGDFDSVHWAEFWAACYAIAYFEDSAIDAVHLAAETLPKNSWPYQVYQNCVALYGQYPDAAPLNDNDDSNWRLAFREHAKTARDMYDVDDYGCLPDLNNGLAILCILYGDNDYETTAVLSSVAGADGDCTAATAMGLMGIVKGMEGTPEIILDRLYANGEGVYINDKNFDPHIGKGWPNPEPAKAYPDEQLFTDIAADYAANMERLLLAAGGRVEGDRYVIPTQQSARSATVPLPNYDFEQGTLAGWDTYSTDGKTVFSAETAGVYVPGQPDTFRNTIANSGAYFGKISTGSDVEESSLYREIDGLVPGETYKISAYLAGENSLLRLYAHNGDGSGYLYEEVEPAYNTNISPGYWGPYTGWYLRTLYFTPQTSSITVGLQVFVQQKEPTYIVNGNFDLDGGETGTPTGWSVWPGPNGTDGDASFVEAGGLNNTYRLTHFKAADYAVFTDQTVTGLENGVYRLSAWAVSDGNFHDCFLSAKNFGTDVELTAGVQGHGYPNWEYLVIEDIEVTNNQLTVGFFTHAPAYGWASLDDVVLERVG